MKNKILVEIMNYIVNLLLLFALSCNNTIPKTARITEGQKVTNSKTNNTDVEFKVGAEFYELSDFKNYRFIEIDTYEDFLVNNDNNMYHIIIYEKDSFKYAVIAFLEKNIGVGELSQEWKNTKKTITDIIKYPKKFQPCWNYSFSDENIVCCVYMVFNPENTSYKDEGFLNDEERLLIQSNKAFKIWKIDSENRKFITQKSENYSNILCY